VPVSVLDKEKSATRHLELAKGLRFSEHGPSHPGMKLPSDILGVGCWVRRSIVTLLWLDWPMFASNNLQDLGLGINESAVRGDSI
jgi:hypothetical protein